ncbi:MAG: glutamine synthetase, partial [Proteobacteria bacterium]|nr:glutamine synthetase [Pseudomonadota bacterium]
FKNGRNLFYDADGDHHLSREAKAYIAGLLTHCREFTAITNQWVNSYKRLVPGFEAPTNIAWARRNRSTLVRVPMYKPGKEAATRVELRSPDPACNPYLTFACMLAAGLKGIEENYELPAPVEEDIYVMTAGQRRDRGIGSLPGSLETALEALEGSTLIREALGDHIFTKFVENKHIEWDQYRSQVTNYELEKYLPRL